ncbi:MAG TPA: SdiA-regulated domain-containing protein [Pyrinomonadaceae bacterium]|nr:SdiA-regulated domain-containing protein [Pyrinomonadaceae bacterium]
MSYSNSKLFALLLVIAILLSIISGFAGQRVEAALSAKSIALKPPAPPVSVDLSTYLRIGRFDLPEPTRTAHPANSLLAQEASAVTYDWDTDTLFVVGDGGTSVVQVTKNGQLIDSMTLAPGPSPQGTDFFDTEGVTYVGAGKFVIMEERYRQANLFTYVAGGVLHKTDAQTVKLGTTIGNIGLEGASYDPLTTGATPGFIFVKEKDPQSIFQSNIDFTAGTATNGSPSATSSTDLFNPALANLADFSDVFALSNIPSLNGHADFSHLLVISQESGQIINIDRSGNVSSTLTIVSDPGNPLSVADQTNEGVTMDRDGNLYVVNENGGGDSDHPQLWVYAPSSNQDLPPTAVTLTNQVTSIPENTSTSSAIKMADIIVTDDGLGPNHLSVTGPDAASFQIIGTALYLRAGTPLNATTKPVYNVTVNVDDPTVGNSPDASAPFSLTVTVSTGGTASLIISEVAPWSSGNGGPASGPTSLRVDWFEVTNIGTAPANITGWKMDDDSHTFASAVPLNGISSIAPGESVIFMETTDLPGKSAAFKALWFGANPPPNLRFGSYNGSGVGLSTGSDEVNLYDAGGTLQAKVIFSASPNGPFPSFDNSAGINGAAISTLSAVGVNGAFRAANDSQEIGSPGTIGAAATPVVNISAIDATATEMGDPGTLRISRTGSTVGPLTVSYTIATGPGKASPSDYSPTLNGAATIPSGQQSVDITVVPNPDNLLEGDEALTLTLGDAGSYDVGANATATIIIKDTTQTIVFDPPPNKTFGNPPFNVSATASSGLPVSFAASGNCTVAGSLVTLTGAGNCTITASQAGNGDFSPALDVAQTFSIARAPVTATAGGGSAIYDGLAKSPANCTVTGAYVGSLTCANVPASVGPDPGTTVIAPLVSGDTLTNFDITQINGSFTIGSLFASTQAVRGELNDALGSANKKDAERLRDAIKKLDEDLSGPWTADGNHLRCERAEKVFEGSREAVQKLIEMLRDTHPPGVPDATLRRWINILSAIDRKLAQDAINEAASQGVKPKKIADAQATLNEGDRDASSGHYDEALEDYQEAWQKVKNCGEERDDRDRDDHDRDR